MEAEGGELPLSATSSKGPLRGSNKTLTISQRNKQQSQQSFGSALQAMMQEPTAAVSMMAMLKVWQNDGGNRSGDLPLPGFKLLGPAQQPQQPSIQAIALQPSSVQNIAAAPASGSTQIAAQPELASTADTGLQQGLPPMPAEQQAANMLQAWQKGKNDEVVPDSSSKKKRRCRSREWFGKQGTQ